MGDVIAEIAVSTKAPGQSSTVPYAIAGNFQPFDR